VKLRILADSLRLRLSQSDLEGLAQAGRVEERTHFPGGRTLVYALVRGGEGTAITASFDEAALEVRIPAAVMHAWAASDQVSLTARQAAGDGRVLRILVEKDFKCVVPRAGEEDYDGFPNPNATCG
jgi:hypothetical protein